MPYCENGNLLEKAYKDAGIDIEIYVKPGGNHHLHGVEDPAKIVEFILWCDHRFTEAERSGVEVGAGRRPDLYV